MLKRIYAAIFLMVFGFYYPFTFAQGVNPEPGVIELIANVFISLPGLAAAVLFVTAFIKKRVDSNDDVTRGISAVVSLVLSAAGYFLQQGIFYGVEWYYIFIYGVAAMALANGLSTWDTIKALLVLLKLRVPAN